MENMSGISILGSILWSFLPVWIGIVVVFAVSIKFKQNLGLYGKLFNSTVGMIGLGLLLFWVFTALFADVITGPLSALETTPVLCHRTVAFVVPFRT